MVGEFGTVHMTTLSSIVRGVNIFTLHWNFARYLEWLTNDYFYRMYGGTFLRIKNAFHHLMFIFEVKKASSGINAILQ